MSTGENDEPRVHVVMAKTVAARWLSALAHDEYRFSVYGFEKPKDLRHSAGLLRSWREGKTHLASLSPPANLGIREHGDRLELWSSDLAAIRKLAEWYGLSVLETTFIW